MCGHIITPLCVSRKCPDSFTHQITRGWLHVEYAIDRVALGYEPYRGPRIHAEHPGAANGYGRESIVSQSVDVADPDRDRSLSQLDTSVAHNARVWNYWLGGKDDFDVLVECSGAPTALADGMRRLRTNGRAAMVGMPKQAVELPLSKLNVKELTIGLVNRYAHTWPTAISLVSSGRVDVASIVTHRFALDETAEALMLGKHAPDSMKAVIAPQR